MKSNVLGLLARSAAWWSARPAREQRALMLAGAVVLLALAVVSIEGLVRERARLDQALPTLQAQLARMDDDAAELMRLRTRTPPASVAPEALAAAVASAASARGLDLAATVGEGGVVVTGRADVAALADWLAAVQSELRLRPVRARMAGGVVELTLAWSPGAQR